jgi:hypothetical protein
MLLDAGVAYWMLFLYLFSAAFLESTQQAAKAKKVMVGTTMCTLVLFIGLRWETGTDWNSYKELFDTLRLQWSYLLNVYHFEIGYVLFNAMVKTFTNSYTVFLLINSFITIFVLCKFIAKTSPRPNLSLLLFYTAFMVAQFMGGNRRMMAMVFLLWAFYFLFEGSKKNFFLLLALAFFFHHSAIVGLAALFLPLQAISTRKVCILLLACFTVGIMQLPFKAIIFAGDLLSTIMADNSIVERILYYGQMNDQHLVTSTGSMVLHTVMAVLKRSLFLLFYCHIIRCYTIDKLTGFFFNIYILGFAGYLLLVGTIFQVSTAYFALIEIVLLGRMFNYSSKSNKAMVLGIIFILTALQLTSALNVYPDLYMPYISCFADKHRITY